MCSGSRMFLFSIVCNERRSEPHRQDLLSRAGQDLSYDNRCWLMYRFVHIHDFESMSSDIRSQGFMSLNIKPWDLPSDASCRCSFTAYHVHALAGICM